MTHHKNYKSLKVRIHELEQQIKKLSKRSTNQAKCLFRDWVGWWANKLNIGRKIMPYKNKKKQKAYKASGGWKKSKPTGKSKSYTKKKK
jgi:hypothetical protein